MNLQTLPLYFHTLRHLKPRQLGYQVIRRLLRPSLPRRRVPAARRSGVSLRPVISRPPAPGGELAFRFLNEERLFSPGPFDWHPADVGKLWRYNLHYFDCLREEGRSTGNIRLLLDSWIAANPPGTVDAWEPFPLSLRMVNWIAYFLTAGEGGGLPASWLESLYDQALWLERSVEHHLLANHYFKNGKALVFAGMFFSGNDADRWLEKGRRIVGEELDEQILPDGGHFERSPMYHAMILEDCLDLLNLERGTGNRGPAEKLAETCRAMLWFLGGMIHPDGHIALFNDAALGIEATYAQLADYFRRLTGEVVSPPEVTFWEFPHTGYYVMAPTPGDRLIMDCGPVGPDYQPGHSHCDTLSFELSLGGERLIVDSGCGLYTAGEVRAYQRGNAGHNGVTIDGADQSQVWGAHRCARRAAPLSPSFRASEDGALIFSGGHDGYRRLPGAPLHRRILTWQGGTIRVEDVITGSGTHRLESRLHLHPACRVQREGESFVVRRGGEVVARIACAGSTSTELREGVYSPEFGLFHPCPLIVATVAEAPLPHATGWIIETFRPSGDLRYLFTTFTSV